MSDSFEERGDAAPDTLNTAIDAVEAPAADTGPVDASAFAALGLAPELVAAVADLGYTQPTTVQARVMPKALLAEGETRYADLMVSSQTGSGKTAAFLLPVLHTLLKQQAEADRAREKAAEKAKAEADCADCHGDDGKGEQGTAHGRALRRGKDRHHPQHVKSVVDSDNPRLI